jgi:hypothetical protein
MLPKPEFDVRKIAEGEYLGMEISAPLRGAGPKKAR